MPKIYAYTKFQDEYTTHELRFGPAPEGADASVTELCTIDDITYVSVPDDIELAEVQHDEIKATIVTMTDELKERIKSESEHCKLIAARLQGRIRLRYSQEDENYINRISVGKALGMYHPSAGEVALIQSFGGYLEECRAWAKAERQKLGL